jgi:alpha-D-xyloside xylohydrolase
MKFTDGYWLPLPGVETLRPRDVADVRVDDDSLTIWSSTGALTSRGDTLNRPLITTSFTTPMEDVIGVCIEHFGGMIDPEPRFEVFGGAADPKVGHDAADGVAHLESGSLRADVRTAGGWGVEFVGGGRTLTSSTARSVGIVTDASGAPYVHEQLTMGVGEHIYGLGERFGPLVKNGQSVDIWNADGGTASEQAYKNVPFYLSDAGYGVFVDDPGLVSFEVGTEVVSRNQFSVAGHRMRYYVIYGPTPKEILRKYTALTGRPARLPAWSYGLWLSTSFTTSYDEKTVTSFVDGMAERDLPLSVFHFDCFWMRQFHWCDFVWDPATFPDPAGMLSRLRARGLHICVWINPYIAERSRLFAEGMKYGYLVRRPDGSVWQTDMWQAGMALVDFTNPEATEWYTGYLRDLLGQGVDAFKTDFGERIPTDVVWHDGSDPQRMHNYYTHLYNKAVFEMLVDERGEGEAVLFARSATAGGQQFPVHWGGDCESTFESMAEELRGGLSLSLSGFGFWSHDIGGFEGTPDPAVFKRWLAFGLLSSHSRLHGSDSYRVPWAFDEEAVDVTRTFTHLKHRLLPYIAEAGERAHEEGVPVMRPMVLEFPGDPGAATVETQYMLGGSLLVAPVFSAEGDVDVYVPEGTWTSLLTGESVVGPRWVHEKHGFESLPLYVRPGTVLPVGARTDRPDTDWVDGITLRLFDLPDGHRSRTRVPSPSGGEPAYFDVERTGDEIRVVASGTDKAWSVRVEPDGGSDAGRPDGVLAYEAPAGTSELSLTV